MIDNRAYSLLVVFFIGSTIHSMKDDSYTINQCLPNELLIKIFNDGALSSKDPFAYIKALLESCKNFKDVVDQLAKQQERSFNNLSDLDKSIIRIRILCDPYDGFSYGKVMLWAACLGNVIIFKRMLEAMPMVDSYGTLYREPRDKLYYIRDQRGNTAFHLASFAGKSDILSVIADELGFESKGSLWEHVRIEKNTEALYYAIQESNSEEVRGILHSGGHPNGFMKGCGIMPLQLLGSSRLCGLMKESPLHCAVKIGSLEIVQILVDAGADMHVKDSENRIPSDYAYAEKQWDIVFFLNGLENRSIEKKINKKIEFFKKIVIKK